MNLYFVKKPLFGIAKGRVERFHHSKAVLHEADGAIERVDPKNSEHRAAAIRDGYGPAIGVEAMPTKTK